MLTRVLAETSELLIDIDQRHHSEDDKPDNKTSIFYAWLQEQTGLHLQPLTHLKW